MAGKSSEQAGRPYDHYVGTMNAISENKSVDQRALHGLGQRSWREISTDFALCCSLKRDTAQLSVKWPSSTVVEDL